MNDAPIHVRLELELLRGVLWQVADRTGVWLEPLSREPFAWHDHAPGRTSFFYPHAVFLVDVARDLVVELRGGVSVVYDGTDGHVRASLPDAGLAPMRALQGRIRPPERVERN